MQNETINDFFKTCKDHIVVIILIPIIVISMVYIVNKMILPPKYEATTQLVISMQKVTDDKYYFDNLRSSMQLVDTFSSIAQSEKVMEEVKNKLQIKNNANKIAVVTDDKSLIVNINVIGREKNQVVDVANAVAISTQEKFKNFFDGMETNILDRANSAKKTSITSQLILGLITGLMSSLIYIFSVLFFSSIITKEKQVKQLGYISLGDVPLTYGKGEDLND